jgi:hypothetical protein
METGVIGVNCHMLISFRSYVVNKPQQIYLLDDDFTTQVYGNFERKFMCRFKSPLPWIQEEKNVQLNFVMHLEFQKTLKVLLFKKNTTLLV